nr:LacI family DNA-binding transcriptional regulator [uncultured Sphaerochaeta sp.]
MGATRNSVANMAGVSSATVSRVYNNPGKVSPSLAKRVLEAAKELGYEPNSAAATLRRSGTGTIAFVQFRKEERPYYWGNLDSFDWFFGRAIKGVQEVLAKSSWQMRFYTVETRRELEAIAMRCDGILAYDVDTQEEEALFSSISIPYVLAHHLTGSTETTNCVRTDNRYGGTLQAQYLRECGVLNPLYITGYLESVVPHAERLAGFREHYREALVLSTEIGNANAMGDVAQRVQKLIDSGDVDGIAAVNDMLLFSLLLRIKTDLPKVGYDASPLFGVYPAPVASIAIQSGELYRQAAEKLLCLLAGNRSDCTTVFPKLIRSLLQ